MPTYPYWIANLADGSFRLWVKLPSLPANSTVRFMIVKQDGFAPNEMILSYSLMILTERNWILISGRLMYRDI